MLISLFPNRVNLDADGQAWCNKAISITLSPRITVSLSHEIRTHQVTCLNPYLKNWQGYLSFKVTKNIYIALAYKREDSKKENTTLSENRYTIESGLKIPIYKKLGLDLRLRNEIRHYDQNIIEENLRLRLRLRIKYKVKIYKANIEPFLAIEPFADTRVRQFNRYRFYLGSFFHLGKNLVCSLTYIRQGTRHQEALDILFTGLEIKF